MSSPRSPQKGTEESPRHTLPTSNLLRPLWPNLPDLFPLPFLSLATPLFSIRNIRGQFLGLLGTGNRLATKMPGKAFGQ